MKRHTFFLVILIQFCFVFVSGKECRDPNGKKNVDLRREFFREVDQGPIGSCYAHAEAIVLSHELQRLGDLKPFESISAEGIFLRYNEGDRNGTLANILSIGDKLELASKELTNVYLDQKDLADQLRSELGKKKPRRRKVSELKAAIALKKKEYSDLLETNLELNKAFNKISEQEGGHDFNNVQKDGLARLCLDTDFLSYKGYIDQKVSRAQAYERFTHVDKEDVRRSSPVSNSTSDTSYLKRITGVVKLRGRNLALSEQARCGIAESYQGIFPGLNLEDLKEILFKTEISDPLAELHKRLCKRSYNYNVEVVRSQPRNNVLPNFDEALERGTGRASSLRFDARIFSNPLYYTDKNFDINKNKDKGPHASVIVGRRYNCETNSFDYILKNSWGKEACKNSKDSLKNNFVRTGAMPKGFHQEIYDCEQLSKCYSKEGASRRACYSRCTDISFEKFEKVSEVPIYKCEGEFYVVPSSVIQRGAMSSRYVKLKRK